MTLNKEDKVQNDNYDKNFALFYDEYLTGHAKRSANKILELNKNLGKNNSIIDFMCGTGTLLEIFDKKGWRTTGVDLSEQMLSIAKSRLKNTELFLNDVTLFRSKEKYDMVVSTADAFNHLPKKEMIQQGFEAAVDCLNENGSFIFDMNTILGIEKNAYYISSSDEKGLSIREGFVDKLHKIGYTRFQGTFTPSGSTKNLRFDSIIYNYMYHMDDVKKMLVKAGFRKVDIKDYETLEEWEPKLSERVLIIATL
ncbi:class I SAM-dependent DNA methyltransferase [Lactiplantibacillus plantarum]|uniref:class I SAM-dependent DNA methyltransferase n=1 Tax=Lactiplantibacillus plantarum TaxID=1590 RepID=UPI0005EEAB34|nr:class I SAM-dependent methyltransferase [Lactiplantibacillus plantarum]KZV02948.1 Methyltransferase [Lactiplantibacillus plantarum]OEZ36619.1 hypothetical protein A6B36_00050 [Lactiplantibacillus plantarum]WBB05483.1 methyltransferase domain-containing protein [Lactiplantibacillus plantarum]